jgi:hypothetical protein
MEFAGGYRYYSSFSWSSLVLLPLNQSTPREDATAPVPQQQTAASNGNERRWKHSSFPIIKLAATTLRNLYCAQTWTLDDSGERSPWWFVARASWFVVRGTRARLKIRTVVRTVLSIL